MRMLQLFAVAVLACGHAAAQVTESPFTTAPGKVLVRIDGIRLALDREDSAGNLHTATAVGSTTIRAGLTSDIDLQLGFDLFLRESFTSRGRTDHHSGLGALSFRTKWTIWRDEKQGAALAVLPFVTLPTGSKSVTRKSAEGGIIVPWAMDAGAGLRTGAMFEWDMLRNDADDGYDARWLVTAFVERALTGTIAVYG